MLLKVLDSGPPDFARKKVLQPVKERSGVKLDEAAFRKWWSERGASLRRKNENKRFE